MTNTTILTGGSCLWDFGDGAIPMENCDNTVTYTYSDSGVFTITYTYTAGDWTATATADIIVYPPAITPEIAYNTDTGELIPTVQAMRCAWTLTATCRRRCTTWNQAKMSQLTITDANGVKAPVQHGINGIEEFEAANWCAPIPATSCTCAHLLPKAPWC